MKIYLDMCCFNRPYDSVRSQILELETEAKLTIQNLIIEKRLDLTWSFVLSLENQENPHEGIRGEIEPWKNHAAQNVLPESSVEELAREYVQFGIKPKDAAHISCAVYAGCKYLITTDRKMIKKAGENIKEILVLNPIDFLAILEGKYEK